MKTFTFDDLTFEVRESARRGTLEIIVDRTSIEIFGNDGLAYITASHIAKEDNLHVKAFSSSPFWSNKAQSLLDKLEVYEMSSIWQEK